MTTSERLLRSVIHAVAAFAFFYLFQSFVLNQPQYDSIVFSGALAVAAAGLSWYQTKPQR